MKRRRLWAGAGAAAVAAAGTATWAVMTPSETTAAGGTSDTAARNELTAGALLQAGLLQARHQDLPGAEATFRRALEVDPDNKLAWFNVGAIAQQSGRPAEALRAYDAALKTDPSFTSALFNKAVLVKASDPDQAITLLERAVSVNPAASTAHFQLGETLAAKGRESEARDAYRRAVAVDASLHGDVPARFRDAARPSPSPTTSPGR
ncbi:tetratricopeptide repeat protein [Streptomyces pacificus]|nr:tetratricopeptide repeat protein [Streptomyces pacificus]